MSFVLVDRPVPAVAELRLVASRPLGPRAPRRAVPLRRLDGGGLNSTARVIAWINIALCVVAVLPVIVGFGLLASTGVSTS